MLLIILQIIDLATLTGACRVALGPSIAGTHMFSIILQGCAEKQVFEHIFINHAGKSDSSGERILRNSFSFYSWEKGGVGVLLNSKFLTAEQIHSCYDKST
jgi:hypothetical protein